VFRHEQAGPGGWGDPLGREPARVLRDVKNGLVGRQSARDDYGIVIDETQWKVDEVATRELRATLSRARGWTEPPAVSR
jgi:N-methylhydantoinase B